MGDFYAGDGRSNLLGKGHSAEHDSDRSRFKIAFPIVNVSLSLDSTDHRSKGTFGAQLKSKDSITRALYFRGGRKWGNERAVEDHMKP